MSTSECDQKTIESIKHRKLLDWMWHPGENLSLTKGRR